MVTISLIFAFIAGIVATFAIAKNNSLSILSISYFILGVVSIELVASGFSKEGEQSLIVPGFLWTVLTLHFLIGELTKHKTGLVVNFIPLLSAVSALFLFDLSGHTYGEYVLEGNLEFFLVALLAAITPFLTHLAKLGISNLVIRFGQINWADNEENYLESMVSYAFIGGVAALGNFLLGSMGLIVAAAFYLSASLVARNKLGLKNGIILAASSAMLLLVVTPVLLKEGGYDTLNFLRGEVIEGAFVAGFMILSHELFMKLARFNTGKWRFLFSTFALLLPILSVLVLGFAYLTFERLGGILALGGILSSLAILSILFNLFKNSSFINLKLITVGSAFLISPLIKPVERTSNIDLSALGIEAAESDNGKNGKPEFASFSTVVGQWKIDESASKIHFELGPTDGRTKGEFKAIAGSIHIKEELTASSVDVSLQVKDLTTYIKPRDEELMGKDYFNQEKYPEIKFTATEINMENKKMVVSGDFTMMDVTKSIAVHLHLVGKGEKDGTPVIVLGGSASIDRTEFGQSPSAKIGNLVDFEIEVQAIKE
jgi:polyisoprenoid-binding protein YceI